MLYQNRTFLPRPFFGIGHKGEDKMLLSNVYVWTKNRARWRFDVREILHSAYLLNLCDSALCNHYFGSQKINFENTLESILSDLFPEIFATTSKRFDQSLRPQFALGVAFSYINLSAYIRNAFLNYYMWDVNCTSCSIGVFKS